MILDALSASAPYEALGPRFARAFRWLKTVDPTSLPEGRIDLDGDDLEVDDLYVTVMRGKTKALSSVKWEAHRRYADIHYVAEGAEAMLWESLGRTKTGIYQEDKDLLLLEVESWADFEVIAGQFTVFFPTDAHRPGIEIPGADPVVKLVVKVRLD